MHTDLQKNIFHILNYHFNYQIKEIWNNLNMI